LGVCTALKKGMNISLPQLSRSQFDAQLPLIAELPAKDLRVVVKPYVVAWAFYSSLQGDPHPLSSVNPKSFENSANDFDEAFNIVSKTVFTDKEIDELLGTVQETN
jgi:hypothetical protein